MKSISDAVRTWAQLNGEHWNTGLSPEGIRYAQGLASEELLTASFRSLPNPPKHLLIWCASNVFTAPLEWVAQFAALGTKVTLKAPTACPAPVLAMAEAFADWGVTAHNKTHTEALELLEDADAVLAFGSDGSMTALNARIPPHVPRSLHGHRASSAIVEAADSEATARGLYLDSAAYDSRGCMSPIAVFCLGDAEKLLAALHSQWASKDRLPIGELSLAEQAHRNRRIGLAKILDTRNHHAGANHPREILLPLEEFELLGLPRLLPIHPIKSLKDLDFLRGGPWSSCATDLAPDALTTLGFHRICKPGDLQRPPLHRFHDGIDVLSKLCTA